MTRRRIQLYFLRLAFAPSLCFAVVGCRSSPDPIADSPIVVMESPDAPRPLRAENMYPPRESAVRFHVVGGDDGGAILLRETTAADKYKSQWMTVESIVDAEGENARATTFWSLNDAGDALLHASIDHEENALTLFNPPLVVAKKELPPGDSVEASSPMRVVSDSNPAQKKESGEATQTITHAGMVRIRTALGELDAIKVTIEFKADLSMADAIEHTELYVSEDRGVVAERRTRKINILGLGGSTHEELLTIAGDK